MPGCGKSTVGRQLARQLGWRFADSDAEIEAQLGCSIRDYFARAGEPAFRDVEAEVIDRLTREGAAAPSPAGASPGTPAPGLVLATGGGAVLRPENRDALHGRSTVFYLRATPEELARRLRHDTQRPLLQGGDPLRTLRNLFRERDPLYRRTAHYVVETPRPSVPALLNMVLMQLELAGLVDPARVPATIGHH